MKLRRSRETRRARRKKMLVAAATGAIGLGYLLSRRPKKIRVAPKAPKPTRIAGYLPPAGKTSARIAKTTFRDSSGKLRRRGQFLPRNVGEPMIPTRQKIKRVRGR